MADFRDLPGIDRLLQSPALKALTKIHGTELVKRELRALQDAWRSSGNLPDWVGDEQAYAQSVGSRLAGQGYQQVFNLTGTIIHTNLGRALLSETTLNEIVSLVTRPMNLEFDLTTGKRGDRDKVVEERLKLLTGAEAATVVNNGAAALMLVLNTLALSAEVAVSRGELIEIGGSFRLPDIMHRSGCQLREVGTTNRTHLQDYQAAIGAVTRLLLKVHPSNYHISGFTSDVGVRELAELAHASDLPLCVDLGSGTLIDLTKWGLPHEPTPQEILAQGADLVTFSGDKLLGAVQAGIIVGKTEFIEQLKHNPMKRALRPDKLTLAYLDRTLALYENPDDLAQKIPLLKTLTTPLAKLEARAEEVRSLLQNVLPGFAVEITAARAQIGSGSLPDQTIDSCAVTLSHENDAEVRNLAERLRGLPIPVIGRIQQDRLWLDMRGADLTTELTVNLSKLAQP